MTAPTSRDRPPADDPPDDRLGVSGTQVLAGVLASVSAAVVTSFFGVAGTIAGAAVVSVVATVGGAAYNAGIRRTQARLQGLQNLRLTMPGRRLPRGEPGGAEATPGAQSPPGADLSSDGGPAAGGGPVATARQWLARHRLGLAGGAALVFALSLAIVTGVELLGDRPLSGQSNAGGRTSIGSLLSGGDGGDTDDVDVPDDGVTSTVPPGGSGTDQSTTTVGDETGTDPQTPTGEPTADDTTTTTSTPSTTEPPAPTDGETAPTSVPADPGSSAGPPTTTGAEAASGTEVAGGAGWQTAAP